MALRPSVRFLALMAMLALVPVLDARASEPAPSVPHIRAADPRLRVLLTEAMEVSPMVHALVERIASSNVIVYVACEVEPHVRLPGRLNFVTAAGGLRYVVIRLKPRQRHKAIAVLAHELQHAAEIADNASIVDEASLAREYERVGYRSHSAHGVAFDTKAAVETGRRVAEELGSSQRSSLLVSARPVEHD
jgi:hypothetical protein